MAITIRTIDELYQLEVAEKENQPTLTALQPSIDTQQTLLDDLSTPSKVAIWRLLFYDVAVVAATVEDNFRLFLEEVQEKEDTLITGVDRWYADTVKTFQLGDSLEWNGSQYVYPVLDEEKRIVDFASAITVGSVLNIKVGKDDGAGLPEKLSVTELAGVTSFVDQIGFSGTDIVVISDDADLLKLQYNIVYDPAILASDGSSVTNPATFPVEVAINSYISTLGENLRGEVVVAELTDTIQAVGGVLNAVATLVEAKPANFGSYLDILDAGNLKQTYNTHAGYAKIDPAFPLSSNLTYLI